MTDTAHPVALPRPAAPEPGPLDDAFYDLVETRFRRLVHDNPILGTALGLHDRDDTLGDGGREQVLTELAAERDHLSRIEALDADGLSSAARFERELEIHNLRRNLFDLEVHRVWERRSTAMDGVGDPLFAIFARDFAPLPDRLRSMTARMEDVPRLLEEHRSRATLPQVRLWQELELDSARDIVVHCRTGVRSAQAVEFLQDAGFDRVWNLKGGIHAWADEIDASLPKY